MKKQFRYSIFILSVTCSILYCSCATWKMAKSGRDKIQGKTFVIIGASSGIGRGVAEKLGEYHANVVLAARRTSVLDEVAAKIKASGGTAIVVSVDISKPKDVQQLMDTALKVFNKIDVWINDAGVFAIGRFLEVPLEDHLRVIDVNLKGFISGSYIALNQFKKQGYGTLINVGSGESEVPIAYHSSYAATKAGIRSVGNAISQELRIDRLKKIKVVTIEPWTVDTPIWDHAANYSGGTARSAAMDPPRKVVNAIIWSSLHPKKELAVGWKSKLAWQFHHVFPHFSERLAAEMSYHYQYKMAPPAPKTDGNLFEPMKSGTGIDGGAEERMENEKRQRKRSKHLHP